MPNTPTPPPIWPGPAQPPIPPGGGQPNQPAPQAGPAQPAARRRIAFARIVPRAARHLAPPATQLHFDGQLAGESVIWIKRRSLLSLVTSAWPIFAGILALVLLTV